MFCNSLNQLYSNTKISSLITYSLLRIVCSPCTSLGTNITREMTCGSESTQMSAYSDILLWMSKLMLVWNQGGHIQEAESQEKNTEKRKGSEQFLVQRLTLLEHGGPCLLESPQQQYFSFFLRESSKKGVK